MSMSGGVMSNVALDAALNELGMLSTVTNSRQDYVAEQLTKGLSALDIEGRRVSRIHRTRSRSYSAVDRRIIKMMRNDLKSKRADRSLRTLRMKNDLDHLPSCSSNQLPHLDPVPYIALPMDSVLSSNLFKSRSMESIDARTSDDGVCATEKELMSAIDQEIRSDTISSLAEVDSVSSGLLRLNVSE